MNRRSSAKTAGIILGTAPLAQACFRNQTLVVFIEKDFPGKLNEPQGNLRHQYIDPGAANKGICWDWDVYYSLTALQPWSSAMIKTMLGCRLTGSRRQPLLPATSRNPM